MPDLLEFGPIALHGPVPPNDIPAESVKVFMPASDGGTQCIGFLYTDSSMEGWAASQSLRETLAAGKFTTFSDLRSMKQHLQALYHTRHAKNHRFTASLNTIYDHAHQLENQARRDEDTRTRDCMFTLKLYLDSFRAILQIGPRENEIRR